MYVYVRKTNGSTRVPCPYNLSHTVAGTKLVLPGQNIESTIDIWLYFTPDLPLEITLEEVQKAGGGKGLDPDYETRCRTRGCNPTHSKLQPCVLQAAPLRTLG